VGTVPAPPKMTAPRFGAWLASQRGERSFEWVAREVRKWTKDSGLVVNRTAIQKYEQGRIPPWPVLYAFAEVYRVAPGDIATRLMGSVQFQDGRDLLRHAGDQRSGSEGGSPDVPASVERARIRELESELESLKTRWRDVQDVARTLFTIAVGDQGPAAAARKAGRHRTSRKTG